MSSKQQEQAHVAKWRRYCSLLGAFLVILPSGIYSIWGNFSVYVLSYVYQSHGMSRAVRTPWEVSAYLLSLYVGYSSTGYFLKFCNKRILLFSIILVSNGGYFMTYFALKYDVIPWAVSVVFLVGFSVGITESVVFRFVADWPGEKKGYLISIACSGMNFGPFIVNPIITAYVNPGNLSPDITEGRFKFMTQEIILDKVPSLFILLGSIFLCFHMVGFIMLNLHQPIQKSKDATSDSQGSDTAETQPDIDMDPCDSTGNNSDPDRGSSYKTFEDNSQPDTNEGFTPLQTLCSCIFYVLWLCNACRDISSVLLSSFYKSFGQLCIKDDYLLTGVGSFVGIAGGVARLTWGFALDRYRLKDCLVFVFSCVACSILAMYFSSMINKWLYLIVTVFYAAVHSSLFPTIVSSTLVIFGKSHFNHNLGLMNTACMVADVAGPPIFESLLVHFGWFGIFGFTVSLFIFALIVIVVRFPHDIKAKS